MPYSVYRVENAPIPLARLVSNNGLPFFESHNPISFSPDYVWSISHLGPKPAVRVVPSGNIVLDGRCHLNLDFRPLRGLIQSHTIVRSEQSIIACWAHGWRSYFDFVMFVLVKLVRMEHALGSKTLTSTYLAYSQFHQPFEIELLAMLGISPDAVINTTSLRGALTAKTVITANNHSVYYPSPRDLRRLRDRFPPSRSGGMTRKFYLSRSKNRRVTNELELLPILRKYDIEFLGDEPRSVQEQIDLFSSASLIIGPHGANFTNILWARKDAHVIELFSRSYYPPYYYYLAEVIGQHYSCCIERTNVGSPHTMSSQYHDMYIHPSDLEHCIRETLAP